MKQYLLLALAILILAGLAVDSVYVYHNRPVPKPTETTQQAVAAQKASDSKAQTTAVANANAAIASYQGQKLALCSQLKTAKLSNTLCN